jgi:hypothetical protein
LFVPGLFVFREALCERQIALANVVSARVGFVGTDNVLGSVVVGEQIEPVADVFADTVSLAIVLGFEAVVALLEVLASSIDVVSRLAVSAACDVVGSLGQAVAAVVAISPEFLLLLKPEHDNLELAELAGFNFRDESGLFSAAEVEDQLVNFVGCSV